MAITNGYAELDDYKLRFMGGVVDDHKDDEFLEDIIESVSRLIDDITGRRFYQQSETRYYTATSYRLCFTDDFTTVSALKTDRDGDLTYEETWDTGDYRMMPVNAEADTYRPQPYTWLTIMPQGDQSFPVVDNAVELAATFGYAAAAPIEIKEACLLGAHRIRKRLDTPLGVTAQAALGQLTVQVPSLRQDPDFMALLDPYIRKVDYA